MIEPVYVYISGQGWVPQTKKTIWTDGVFAIAYVNDVPDGTPRSESYNPGFRGGIERCIKILRDRRDKPLDATRKFEYDSGEVALYLRKSLPWEV